MHFSGECVKKHIVGRCFILSAAGHRNTAATYFPANIPISKRYLLTYPDGSKKHIDRQERDNLVLSNQAKRTESGNYLFTGQIHTFHSFPELAKLQLAKPQNLRHFLPGYFIIEHAGTRTADYLESPEHLALRYSA